MANVGGMASRLEQAYQRLSASGIYAPGRLDYYRFDVIPQSEDGHVYQLNITFKSGERYCCTEPGCHFGLWSKADWARLRAVFPNVGLHGVHALTITKVRVTVEEGALRGLRFPGDQGLLTRARQQVYEIGPFDDATATEEYPA